MSFDAWRENQRYNMQGYTERDAYEAGRASRDEEVNALKRNLRKAEEENRLSTEVMKKYITDKVGEQLLKRVLNAEKVAPPEAYIPVKPPQINEEKRMIHGSKVKVIEGAFFGWTGEVLGFSGMNNEEVFVEIESPCGTHERGEWFLSNRLGIL